MTLTATAPPLTSPDNWPPLRAMPPDPAQRTFRACLTALSRPGTVRCLPGDCVPASVPAVVAPLLALTDLMTPLSSLNAPTVAGARRAAELIGSVTGARVTAPNDARFALALEESTEMADLAVGSNWSPERGAMLCQRVVGLGDAATPTDRTALHLRLSGPGVKGDTELSVAGLSARFVELRAALTADYPAGVDILLITDDGELAGLPRTTRIEIL